MVPAKKLASIPEPINFAVCFFILNRNQFYFIEHVFDTHKVSENLVEINLEK